MNAVRLTLLSALLLTLSFSSFTVAADQHGAGAPAGASWAQLAKFQQSTGQPYLVGTSVAVDGNTVAVAAPVTFNNQLNGAGAVYVYVKPATGWGNMAQVAVLTASDGAYCDSFGSSVSISGNTIVVGAPQNYINCGPTGPGAAYVFVEPAGGWSGSLTETAKLTASDGVLGEGFGASVGISGSTVVAGAPAHSPNPGAAYVFAEPASGWVSGTQTAKLVASDGQAGDSLGFSVSVSGNTVVAAAPDATTSGVNQAQGAAYVFEKPASGWKNNVQTAKLVASDGNEGAVLGQSVSISGNTVAAGAPGATIGANPAQGAAYLFVEPAGGWMNMTQTAKMTAAQGYAGDLFGSAVAISGDTLVAGAPYFEKGLGVRSPFFREGLTYVFAKPASGWTNNASTVYLTGSDAKFGASLGSCVGVSGNLVVAGAPNLAHYSGGAYLFMLY
jgi:hypothetical protein